MDSGEAEPVSRHGRFFAAFAAILYFLLWLELLDELGIARAPWS
jgi:hypothetical protein